MNPTNYPPKFLVKIYKSGITPIHYLCLYSDNVILFNENLSSKYEYKKCELQNRFFEQGDTVHFYRYFYLIHKENCTVHNLETKLKEVFPEDFV